MNDDIKKSERFEDFFSMAAELTQANAEVQRLSRKIEDNARLLLEAKNEDYYANLKEKHRQLHNEFVNANKRAETIHTKLEKYYDNEEARRR